MSEIIFSVEHLHDNGRFSRLADNTVVKIVSEDGEEIQKAKKYDEKYFVVQSTADDSDNDSLFDESIIPDKPGKCRDNYFDDELEKQVRVVRCLDVFLEKISSKESQQADDGDEEKCEKEYDWNMEFETFDPNRACHVKRLRFNLLKNNGALQAKINSYKMPIPTTKYVKNPYISTLIIRKNNSYRDIKSFYVVFYRSYGCCSSSDRPQRIFKTLERAENHFKKLFNHSQVEDWNRNDNYSGCSGSAGCPSIYKYEWDQEKQYFKMQSKVK